MQLLATGLSSSAIGRQVDRGLLVPEHPGVYRVGHAAASTEATYMAAVLAAGDGGVLAGRAAAHLMRLLKGSPPPPEVLVTTKKKRIQGVKIRRTRKLDPRDVTTWHGIPTTTVARTLVDLAAVLPEPALARAVHEAMVLYRTRPEDVEAVMDRMPNAKGATTLRHILRGDTRITLSRLEDRFLQLLRDHNLELPETNKRIGGRLVDCRWPKRRLTVELDSYRYHASRHAWEHDRKRERQARRRGDDFRRYTSDDVFDTPQVVIDELQPVLS